MSVDWLHVGEMLHKQFPLYPKPKTLEDINKMLLHLYSKGLSFSDFCDLSQGTVSVSSVRNKLCELGVERRLQGGPRGRTKPKILTNDLGRMTVGEICLKYQVHVGYIQKLKKLQKEKGWI